MYSEITELIKENYAIGDILNIKIVEFGSGNTYIVSADKGEFIAKRNEREDFVLICNKVHRELSSKGFNVSAILPTKYNNLFSFGGLVLYEFMQGTTFRKLNSYQMENAIKYMKKYNFALKGIPFTNGETEQKNH
jgi:hypothetical protein